MTSRIIDAHSHIGVDSFYPFEGTLQEYVANAKQMGITDSILMPVTSPAIYYGNHKNSQLLWQFDSSTKSFSFRSMGVKSCIVNSRFKIHPYAVYNDIIKNAVSSFSTDINLHFIPLVHPLLDSLRYLEYILNNHPKAIKIHGIAAGIFPSQVPDDFWIMLKDYNIPVIVHTDFNSSDSTSPISILRNENNAYSWVKILEKNGIKGYITHGARLNKKSIEIINSSGLFVVGIGPDSLIALEPNRLEATGDYLKQLFEEVSINTLCFDLDYPWNVNKPISMLKNPNSDLDFKALMRLQKLGLSNDEYQKVVFINAYNFYGLEKRCC